MRSTKRSDGKYFAVGAIEARFYAELLDGLGLADAELPDQNDRSQWPAMKERFAAIFATKIAGRVDRDF